MPNDHAIVVRGVRKSFGTQNVLGGIDFDVRAGETLAVLGRSGTGKSVLLKLLIGLQPPDAGSIQIHDREITGLTSAQLDDIRTDIGFLFQDAALYDSMTVEENVAFPLHHTRRPRAGRPAPGQAASRVHDLLSFVGMEDAREKLPAAISGGMRKRVGLARALALEPAILLFDEPVSALDPITAAEIERLIRKLQTERHVTSVVVTHDLHGARRIADRLAFLNEGAIVFIGTVDELDRSEHPFVRQYLEEAS